MTGKWIEEKGNDSDAFFNGDQFYNLKKVGGVGTWHQWLEFAD